MAVRQVMPAIAAKAYQVRRFKLQRWMQMERADVMNIGVRSPADFAARMLGQPRTANCRPLSRPGTHAHAGTQRAVP
jgi:hypothetical protein